MQAMVYTKYGPLDGLQLTEVATPTAGDDDVLVAIHASSVNFNSPAFVKGEPLIARLWTGLMTPKYSIPGNDIAGRVAAVGHNITKFKPGDDVFGDISSCGWGAYAEYVAVPQDALTLKPANISFEQAAAVPEAGLVALQGLRDKGQLQPGQKVLIVGASGGIGTFAVQIAKALGADVTAVCSTRNIELVRSLGADQVIDYTQEDFAASGPQYDLILATAGYRSLADYKRALKPGGRYVSTGGDMKQVFEPMFLGPFMSTGGRKMTNLSVITNKDLPFMAELLESGKVVPVIDKSYPLSETVEALKYYEEGRTRGKVIITVEQQSA